MKNLKLKPGFLVDDWKGEISPINYAKINYLHYGNVEEHFLVENDGVFIELLTKWSSKKIFDSLIEAEQHSSIVKQKTIKYYEEQVTRNQEKLKELKKL
jgi:hypothetical protein